ncbi:U5 snRNP protein, DIM1 family [Nematocida minor]|uniref:U5 snRNP protein, DIM1 family n=1 Tax=Nematocida minor TaxID=1912983 RepID=UPI00221E7C7D|nr:U5 snRNP protein, DIM1 family [Nematocida minor]KAI5191784.1 U5 snRNP protein, DIM1 family [Nematocida minor]
MSFFLNNITSEQMFEELLQDHRIALVRFGFSERPECVRLDRLLSTLNKSVHRYFAIAAYEIKDVTPPLRKKYKITDSAQNILVFFSKGVPIYVSFCKRPNFQITEEIPGSEELLSLLVTVHQGVTHNKRIINVYGTCFEGNRSQKRKEDT